MDHDELFNKWQKYMESISEDVAEVLTHRMAFQEYPKKKALICFIGSLPLVM